MDVLKKELKDEITHLLYDQTHRTPIVIPVINEINTRLPQAGNNKTDTKTAEFKRPPAKKFPPKQIPDTEVVEPKNRERLRGY